MDRGNSRNEIMKWVGIAGMLVNKVGLGSPEHKIDEEVCWHGRNISPQVHGVTRSKRKSKSYSKHDVVIW